MLIISGADVLPGEPIEGVAERLRITNYIGGRSTPEKQAGPQGFLVEYPDPKAVVEPHFHPVRQFQVVVRGCERIGKRPAVPYTFQYADPYTPYGPIVGNSDGLAFFTLRPEHSTGIFYMPGSRDKMPGKAGRNVAHPFGALGGIDASSRAALIERTDDGLEAARIRLAPGAEGDGLDPALGGGQYTLVVDGSLEVGGKAYGRLSLVWVDAGAATPRFRAGAAGADLLAMQFPKEPAA